MKLALGRALYDPGDPMGKLFFNILATFAEFDADLIRHAHRQGYDHRPRQGEIARQAAQTVQQTAAGPLPHTRHGRIFHRRSCRALLRLKTNRLSHTQPASFPLAYDPAPYRNRPEPDVHSLLLAGGAQFLSVNSDSLSLKAPELVVPEAMPIGILRFAGDTRVEPHL